MSKIIVTTVTMSGRTESLLLPSNKQRLFGSPVEWKEYPIIIITDIEKLKNVTNKSCLITNYAFTVSKNALSNGNIVMCKLAIANTFLA